MGLGGKASLHYGTYHYAGSMCSSPNTDGVNYPSSINSPSSMDIPSSIDIPI